MSPTPAAMDWFMICWVLGGICHLHSNFNRILCKQTVETLVCVSYYKFIATNSLAGALYSEENHKHHPVV